MNSSCMFFRSMYTFIIQCVHVDSLPSWPKRTEARVTNERTNERINTSRDLLTFIDDEKGERLL